MCNYVLHIRLYSIMLKRHFSAITGRHRAGFYCFYSLFLSRGRSFVSFRRAQRWWMRGDRLKVTHAHFFAHKRWFMSLLELLLTTATTTSICFSITAEFYSCKIKCSGVKNKTMSLENSRKSEIRQRSRTPKHLKVQKRVMSRWFHGEPVQVKVCSVYFRR